MPKLMKISLNSVHPTNCMFTVKLKPAKCRANHSNLATLMSTVYNKLTKTEEIQQMHVNDDMVLCCLSFFFN